MKKRLLLLTLCCSLSIFTIGCGDASKTVDPPADKETKDPHAGHDHSVQHGGKLIELGHDHAYFGEFVDDHSTETISIYMTDKDRKPLEVKELTTSLIVTAGDKTQTFELTRSEEDKSMFSSKDAQLMEMHESKGATIKLLANINGKQLKGSLNSGHDHAGHDH